MMRLGRATRWCAHRSAALQRVQRSAAAGLAVAVRRALSAAAGSGSGSGSGKNAFGLDPAGTPAAAAAGAGARADPVAAALAAAEAAQAREPLPHFTLSPHAGPPAGGRGRSDRGGGDGPRTTSSHRGGGGGGRGGGYGGRGRGRGGYGGGRPRGPRVSPEMRVPGMALKLYETATAARAVADAARATELWDAKRESIDAFVARVKPSVATAVDVFAVAFDPTDAAATATATATDALTQGLPRAAYTEAQVRVAHAQLQRAGAAAGAVVDPTPYSAVDAQWRAAITALDEKLLRSGGDEVGADAMARILALSKSTGFADGKWLFFLPTGSAAFSAAEFDAVWHALATATARGVLGSSVKLAKATKVEVGPPGLQHMVEVATPDFTATADVMRVRDAIKRIVKAALAPHRALHNSAAAAGAGAAAAGAGAAAGSAAPAAPAAAAATGEQKLKVFEGVLGRPAKERWGAIASENGARLMYKPRIMSFIGVYRDHPYGIRPTTVDDRVDFA